MEDLGQLRLDKHATGSAKNTFERGVHETKRGRAGHGQGAYVKDGAAIVVIADGDEELELEQSV